MTSGLISLPRNAGGLSCMEYDAVCVATLLFLAGKGIGYKMVRSACRFALIGTKNRTFATSRQDPGLDEEQKGKDFGSFRGCW